MKRLVLFLGALLVIWLFWAAYENREEHDAGRWRWAPWVPRVEPRPLPPIIVPVNPFRPEPHPAPHPEPHPKPHPGPHRPHRGDEPDKTVQEIGAINVGGPLGPDGKTQVACDLPTDQRVKNCGGRDGEGLCVFTSIMHSARYQNEPRLSDFQKNMKREPGGGYPSKVDAMIAKYGAGTPYLQYEGKDPAILAAAIKSGRMPGVTYNGHDPHYGGTIAHMVSLVAFDESANLAAILDNNFIGDNELVWLAIPDFLKRWQGGGSGWAVVLLSPPPPPVPHN